jgi:hypothetical protein
MGSTETSISVPDLDGVDYWVWKALECPTARRRAEYNAI